MNNNRYFTSLLCFAITGILSCNYAMPVAAQVVPDGATATSVQTNANGHVTVQIAPPFTGVTGDVSHNSYTEFNVLKPGVTLDNSFADARSIVNEVTGANPSLITGTLDVLGPQAHVILANPNGITVDGGRFVNTGGVILSTGKVSYVDRDITPITTQRNTLLTTNKGVIRIEGDGLAGVFSNLELIAKEIHVDADITNLQNEENARIRLAGGSSTTEVDSSISVVDITNDWTRLTPSAPTDTCPNAICVDVTGRGSLSSSKIEVAVTDAGAGVKLAGNLAARATDMVLASNGDITVTGSLTAERNQVVTAPGTFEVKGSGSIRAGGTVAVQAGHTRIEDNGIVVVASANIRGKKLTLHATGNGEGHTPQLVAVGGGVDVDTDESISVEGGIVFADGNVILRSAEITTKAVQNGNTWHGASVTSSNSGVLIESRNGAITNTGAVIQGKHRIDGIPESEAAVTLRSATSILNQSPHVDAPALLFGVDDAVTLRAAGDITNSSGRIVSGTRVLLASSGGSIRNIVEKTSIPQDGLYEEYAYNDGSFLFKKTKVKGRRVQFGELLSPEVNAFVTARDGVVLQAKGAVVNDGGEIYATEGGISLIGSHVENNLVQAGSAYTEIRCSWFCREVGSSNLTASGGVIRASANITINAQDFISKGGVLQATEGNVVLTVPGEIRAEAVPVYTFLNVDRGIFQGNVLRLLRHDQGGSLIANRGRIIVNSPNALLLDGGIVDAPDITAPNGIDTLRLPESEAAVFPTDNLGLLDGVL